MNPVRKALAIAFLFLASSGIAVVLFLTFQGSRAQVEFATILPAPTALPDFAMVDHTGQPFGKDQLLENWSVIFFGFTHCPDICPATLQQLVIARSRVIEAGGEFPRIILISVDPERDTPSAMAAYVGNFGDDIIGVSGNPDELVKLTKTIGIFFAKSGDLDGNYSVDHSAAVLVINENAEWHSLFSAPHNIDSFVHDLPILTGQN